MSNKKQISSLCTLYSVYDETPEDFSDETDVESYFYQNILNISQSHHRIARVSKGSKKTLCVQGVSFSPFIITAAIYSQGGSQHFQNRN